MPTTSPDATRTFTLSDFDFVLPENLIAQHPATERSGSRLLDGTQAMAEPTDRIFRDLPTLLRAGDLVVFNDTKVINARLFGEKPTGGKLELLIERVLGGNQVAAHMRVRRSRESALRSRWLEHPARTTTCALHCWAGGQKKMPEACSALCCPTTRATTPTR